MWEFADASLSIQPFRSKNCVAAFVWLVSSPRMTALPFHWSCIRSRLDKYLYSYASRELLMGGENNSFKPKAFFRSLLAFHEEGLYEVPYIL